MNRYRIIYADCSWDYHEDRCYKTYSPTMGRITYPTMTSKELKALPVYKIAEKDCALFLWATFPKLANALKVIEAWGFRYVTNAFTWVKTYKNGNIALGLGHYTRGNAELCLLAKKGRPKRLETATNISQIVIAPRSTHSAKPPEVRDRIVKLMGDVPRIELFARERVPGWDSLGYDVDGLDIRRSLYMVNVSNLIRLNSDKGGAQ